MAQEPVDALGSCAGALVSGYTRDHVVIVQFSAAAWLTCRSALKAFARVGFEIFFIYVEDVLHLLLRLLL